MLAAALGVLGVLGASSCKKHRPPARTRIWLGASHACALQKTGELECWGANEAGQLGDGSTIGRTRPGPVTIVVPEELALGARHTCGLRAGSVRCWGDGSRGQLGTGKATSLEGPNAGVVSAGALLAGVTAIAAAGDRSCALTAEGVRCWGDAVLDAKEPQGFEGAGAASAIAVGGGHVCAAFSAPRAVRCSGPDDHGQSAGQKPVLEGAAVTGLTAGSKHTCAVLDDGSIQCWGANDRGQLGDGTTTDARVPVLVHGLPPATEVRAGANHTCARLRTNTIACWGDNSAHQLVNGTSDPSSRPAPIRGLIGVQELVAAGDSTCVRLTTDGAVRCWGANDSGQLGDGTTAPHAVPMPVTAAPAAPAK